MIEIYEWIIYDLSKNLPLREFVSILRSSVWVVFNQTQMEVKLVAIHMEFNSTSTYTPF